MNLTRASPVVQATQQKLTFTHVSRQPKNWVSHFDLTSQILLYPPIAISKEGPQLEAIQQRRNLHCLPHIKWTQLKMMKSLENKLNR